MKNNLTFGQLDAISMDQAGNLSQNDIEILIRQAYVNLKLMRIYRMLDGLNDPWYNKLVVLTISADNEYLKDSTQGGTITALAVAGSTITITRSALLFVAGSMLNITLINPANGQVLNHCLARVTTGGAVATAAILSGTMITYVGANHRLTVIGIKSFSATSGDLSDIYFKDIIRITDENYTAVPGAKTRVFTPYKDSQLFAGLSTNPMKAGSVGWYQRADTIEFFVGSSANALGVLTCEYRGKPALFSDATIDNTVDIPPEDNNMLIDEVTACYLIAKGKSTPPDMSARLAQYQKQYESAEADKAKAMEKMNS